MFKQKPVATAVKIALAISFGALAVTTQAAYAQGSASRTNVAASATGYDIRAGSLTHALNTFAHDAGVVLSFDPELTAGKNSTGIRGAYTVEEGFDALLQGSGLAIFHGAGNSYTLRRASPASTNNPAVPSVGIAVLSSIHVAGASETPGFSALEASPSSTKLDTPLFETPRSVTVVNREVLDTRQVTSINEALQTVAGVTSGGFGRRGWDDFNIRGQTASDSMYVDGLRLGRNNNVAQEQFGFEQIDISKGPGSLFGMVQPGGIVNLVTKRPKTEAFNQVGATVGNYGFRQGSFDIGRPLAADSKTAFRIAGIATDQDDSTDHVWSRTRYIAPSLTLDLGPDSDLTILTSYSSRKYIRQQGLPIRGTLLPNRNGEVPRDLFLGDAGFGPYEAAQRSVGYTYNYRLNSGWKLQQNFRALDMDVTGRLVSLRTLAADQMTQSRRGSLTNTSEQVYALDTNLQKAFATGEVLHSVMFGMELNRDRIRSASKTCTVPAINIFNPVYNTNIACPAAADSDSTTTIAYAGFYVRDQMKLTERLRLNLGYRFDAANTSINNNRTMVHTSQDDNASTGNVGLLYQLTPHVAPYVSYATSFRPRGGLDENGSQFKPEKGVQTEAGFKFQFLDKRLNASLAAYDLKRRNNLAENPNNPSFNIQTGEERTKGFEAELSADMRNGLSFTSAFAYTDAYISKDTTQPIGVTLQNVPRRSASLWANYQFQIPVLSGWGVGLGVRYESSKTNPTFLYSVPSYTVADANVSYRGKGYRLFLNIKNLFDRDYYAGALTNDVIPLGDQRTVMLKVVYDF